MDRFEYASPILLENESYLVRDQNVKLYDGEQKVNKLIHAVASLQKTLKELF